MISWVTLNQLIDLKRQQESKMGYSPQETKVQRTFDKAMDQINNLQKVFRDEGMMAKAVVDIGGNQDFGAIQEAFDNLYGALEDAHYDAMAHIEVCLLYTSPSPRDS